MRPIRGGWQVLGAIGQPHRWLNGSKWNRPNVRQLKPQALPSGTRVARPGFLSRLQLQIGAPTPRNLFPGLVQRACRPNGW